MTHYQYVIIGGGMTAAAAVDGISQRQAGRQRQPHRCKTRYRC